VLLQKFVDQCHSAGIKAEFVENPEGYRLADKRWLNPFKLKLVKSSGDIPLPQS